MSRFWRDGGVFAELLVRSCERRRRAVAAGRSRPRDAGRCVDAVAAVPGAWEHAVLPDGLNDAAFLDVARG